MEEFLHYHEWYEYGITVLCGTVLYSCTATVLLLYCYCTVLYCTTGSLVPQSMCVFIILS